MKNDYVNIHALSHLMKIDGLMLFIELRFGKWYIFVNILFITENTRATSIVTPNILNLYLDEMIFPSRIAMLQILLQQLNFQLYYTSWNTRW